jgi:hypothetical protein
MSFRTVRNVTITMIQLKARVREKEEEVKARAYFGEGSLSWSAEEPGRARVSAVSS